MRTWVVTLQDGSDWKVNAISKEEAIKKALKGKGKKIGQYFTKFRTHTAFSMGRDI